MRIKDLLPDLTARFETAGIAEAAADARALVAFAIGKAPVFLRMNPDFEIEPDQLAQIKDFAGRRLKREPVSKITQTRGF